ncbi:replication initiation protein, partial [Bifidobacterium longum]|uniref:replication initiation protein n=1 Tax=Bifidobacterium longum TaxID=216816 RepID=UPI00373FCE09
LTEPVCRTDMARLKPLKLLHAVTEGLRRSVDGDEGYSGLLMKNPLSDAWDSDLCREDTYDLPDLVAALEEHGDMPPKSWTRTKRAREVGQVVGVLAAQVAVPRVAQRVLHQQAGIALVAVHAAAQPLG